MSEKLPYIPSNEGMNKKPEKKAEIHKLTAEEISSIKRGEGERVFDNNLALDLINSGEVLYVAFNLDKFEDLNKDVANELMKYDRTWTVVAEHFDRFTGIDPKDHRKIVEELIKTNDEEGDPDQVIPDYVTPYFDKFTGLSARDKCEIALELLETGDKYAYIKLEKLSELDSEVALKLIEKGEKGFVLDYLDERFYNPGMEKVFVDLNKEVADKIIEARSSSYIMQSFEVFGGINKEDHKEIAIKIIEAGEGGTVIEFFEKLTGIKPEEQVDIVKKLVEKGYAKEILDNANKFTGIESDELKSLVG